VSDLRFWRLLLLIGALAAGLRLGHMAAIQDTAFYEFDKVWAFSDMHANRAWAEHIAGGDWLDLETYRPRFEWQERIATMETWERWLGPTTYYQPPLYTYLLAFGIRITGSPDLFRWAQVLLGAANVILVGLLGRRLFGHGAGLFASLLAAGYAPFILYDGELLRGTLVITLHLLALIALHWAMTRPDGTAGKGGAARSGSKTGEPGLRDSRLLGPPGSARAWIMAGAALGLAYLGDSSIVTFLPFALLLALFAPRGGDDGREVPAWKPPLRRAGLLVAGCLVAASPLMVRNMVAGAPLLSATTRAPLAFVMGNAPGAIPVGAGIPDSAVEILNASDYETLGTIAETLRAHEGDVGALLHLQWRKLRGLLSSYEVPDNPSFYYAALVSPVLAWGLRFSCFSGLALVGLILSARRPREHVLMYAYIAGTVSLFLMAHVVSRYRQPLVIPMTLFAGAALVEAWRSARGRRLARAAWILSAAVAVSLVMPRTPPPGYRYYRPAEFLVAASHLSARGRIDEAADQIEQARSLAEEERASYKVQVSLGLALGELHLSHRRYPEALSAFRDVLEWETGNVEALAALGGAFHDINQPMQALKFLMRAVEADPTNVEVHARLGHLYWTVFGDGEKALPHIRRALELNPTSPAATSLSALARRISEATGLNP
jgi:tetratricopeptide (TPR) repeat protein